MSELCKRCGGSGYLQDFTHMQTSVEGPCNICFGTGLMPSAVIRKVVFGGKVEPNLDEIFDEALMKSHEIIPCPNCETKAKKIKELEALNKNQAEQIDDDVKHITELEAEKEKIFENWGSQVSDLDSALFDLEAKIKRVEELPEKLQEQARIQLRGSAGKRSWARGKATGLRTAIIYVRAALEAENE